MFRVVDCDATSDSAGWCVQMAMLFHTCDLSSTLARFVIQCSTRILDADSRL